jgi:prepilin-type N-terminal cleavage/methylation domain-containing protein/prepilin-type processing-associated H-X9-DG protein
MKKRHGLSLIEVLVVLAVTGILVAMLLPAVQAAREAARRARCLNNLKQIGLALHGYESAAGCFPPGAGGKGQSAHTALLPFLELRPLYDTFNMDYSLGDWPNQTAGLRMVEIFLCPSDGDWYSPSSNNYAANRGVVTTLGQPADGVFPDGPESRAVRLAEIRDGLAQTVAFSEFLVGHPQSSDRRRGFYLPADHSQGGPTPPALFAARCLALKAMAVLPGQNLKGRQWAVGVWRDTLYDHFLPVNAPSCANTSGSSVFGTVTASSQHAGGANALASDGHVTFVKESINLQHWRALGTRGGGEAIDWGP